MATILKVARLLRKTEVYDLNAAAAEPGDTLGVAADREVDNLFLFWTKRGKGIRSQIRIRPICPGHP